MLSFKKIKLEGLAEPYVVHSAISPNGEWGLRVPNGNSVSLINLKTLTKQKLEGRAVYPDSVDFSLDSHAVFCDEKGIHVVQVPSGKIRTIREKASAAYLLPNVVVAKVGYKKGNFIKSKVQFFDLESGKECAKPLTSQFVTELAVSTQGVIAIAPNENKVSAQLWFSRKEMIEIPHDEKDGGGSARNLFFSPDGTRFGFVENQRRVRIFDVKTGQPVAEFSANEQVPWPLERQWFMISNDTALTLLQNDRNAVGACETPTDVVMVDFSKKSNAVTKLLKLDCDRFPQLGLHGFLATGADYRQLKPLADDVRPGVTVEWSEPKPAKTTKTAKKAAPVEKPLLHLPQKSIQELQKNAAPAFKAISACFQVVSFSKNTNDKAKAAAENAAKALKDETLSAGTDWDYSPCVVDFIPKKTDDLRNAANFEVIDAKKSVEKLFNAYDEESDEDDSNEAYRAASEVIAKFGKPTKLEIADHGEDWCTAMLSLGFRADAQGAGVLTVYVNT